MKNMVAATKIAVECSRELYSVLEKISQIRERMTDTGITFTNFIIDNLPNEMVPDIESDADLQNALKAAIDILKFAKGESTTETGHAGKLADIYKWNGN